MLVRMASRTTASHRAGRPVVVAVVERRHDRRVSSRVYSDSASAVSVARLIVGSRLARRSASRCRRCSPRPTSRRRCSGAARRSSPPSCRWCRWPRAACAGCSATRRSPAPVVGDVHVVVVDERDAAAERRVEAPLEDPLQVVLGRVIGGMRLAGEDQLHRAVGGVQDARRGARRRGRSARAACRRRSAGRSRWSARRGRASRRRRRCGWRLTFSSRHRPAHALADVVEQVAAAASARTFHSSASGMSHRSRSHIDSSSIAIEPAGAEIVGEQRAQSPRHPGRARARRW